MNSRSRRNTKAFVSGGMLNSGANQTNINKPSQPVRQQNTIDVNIMKSSEPAQSLQNVKPVTAASQSGQVLAAAPVIYQSSIPVVESSISAMQPDPPINKNESNIVPMQFENSGFFDENDETRKKSYFFKKFLGTRKKQSVRAKEKRIRQNRRLRKVLIPKNALMALHEIKGINISDFVLNIRSGGGFVAEVSVNNIQYEGNGQSKNVAKNNACEKALRDLIISKMLQRPNKQPSIENLDTKASEEVENDGDVQMEDVESASEEDDVPITNLASFALYKLFSEWENEGFEIPEFRSHVSGPTTPQVLPVEEIVEKPKKSPPIRSELPLNWETMHPTTLLCMMRPGISYTELGQEGIPPNSIQRMGVIVDGEHFIGFGRSKKIARRDSALNACNKLFGTNFQMEE